MDLVCSILENLLVVVLTLFLLVCGAYACLLILHFGLKLKSGHREQEGLAALWEESISKQPSSRNEHRRER